MSIEIDNIEPHSKYDVVKYNPAFLSVSFDLKIADHNLDNYPCPKTFYFSEGKIQLSAEPKYSDWAIRAMDNLYCETRPWFVVNGYSDILAKVKFSGRELEQLQAKQIAIFMYEPLFLRNKENGEWKQSDGDFFYCVELDAVSRFNDNHGGKLDIVVYTCEFDFHNHVKKNYQGFEIRNFDTFCLGYTSSVVIESKKLPYNFKPRKKAICLNFRYSPIRHIVISYLRSKNYTKDTHLTFYHHYSEKQFSPESLGVDLKNSKNYLSIQDGLEKAAKEVPYALEVSDAKAVWPDEDWVPDLSKKHNVRDFDKIMDFYGESFVALVNETRYLEPRGIITEKTLNAILYKVPFVIIGSPYLLKYMKQMGFKTYGEFWDESYDEILDPIERLDKIFELVDHIFSMSYDELEKLRIRMQPTVEYNFQHMQLNYIPFQLLRLMKDSPVLEFK